MNTVATLGDATSLDAHRPWNSIVVGYRKKFVKASVADDCIPCYIMHFNQITCLQNLIEVALILGF